jgi:hypothetical protein
VILGLDYWGDGSPLIDPAQSTTGMDYWADGEPFGVLWNPTQYVYPSSIGSAEAFGSHGANQIISPTSITSAETIGTPLIKQIIRPMAITSAEALGTVALNLASEQIVLYPAGIAGGSAVDTHQVIRLLQIINLTAGTASGEAFGTITVLPGPVTLSPASIESQETVGDHIVAPTQIIKDFYYLNYHVISLIPYVFLEAITDGIPNKYLLITPVITFYIGPPDPRSPRPGSPVVIPGTLRLFVPESIPGPDDYYVGLACGVPEIICGPVAVAPARIESAEDFGTAKLVLHVLPTGAESVAVVGTPSVALTIKPDSIVAADNYGIPELSCGSIDVSPISIESVEGVGEPVLDGYVRSIGVESEEGFGVPLLRLFVLPESISGADEIGSPGILYLIKPSGISGAEAVGSFGVVQLIRPAAMGSGELHGVAEVVPGPVWIFPPGIEAGVCGFPRVRPPNEPANLIILEAVPLPTLEFVDGWGEVDLYDSPLRMVVNG